MKYMLLNSLSDTKLYSYDGTEIERVDNLKYLRSYTDTNHDMEVRIGQAWSALHSLKKVWVSPIRKTTKPMSLKLALSQYCYMDLSPGR